MQLETAVQAFYSSFCKDFFVFYKLKFIGFPDEDLIRELGIGGSTGE